MSLEQKYRPQIIKPENMVVNQMYALTINPNDNFQFIGKNTNDRLRVFRNTMEIMLDQWLCSNSKYCMNIEVSAKGRLHLHGAIRVQDVKSFYIYAIPNMLSKCSIELDTIKDKHIWYNYCTKQSFMPPECIKNLVRDPHRDSPQGIYEYINHEEIKEETLSSLDC